MAGSCARQEACAQAAVHREYARVRKDALHAACGLRRALAYFHIMVVSESNMLALKAKNLPAGIGCILHQIWKVLLVGRAAHTVLKTISLASCWLPLC